MLKYFTRNIRYLLSLLFLIVPLYGQETLSDEEIKGISDNIQKIQKEKEVLAKMVSEYEKSAKTDSLLLVKKDEQIALLQERVDIAENQAKLEKPKWFENKSMYFTYGAAAIIIPTYLGVKIVDVSN